LGSILELGSIPGLDIAGTIGTGTQDSGTLHVVGDVLNFPPVNSDLGQGISAHNQLLLVGIFVFQNFEQENPCIVPKWCLP